MCPSSLHRVPLGTCAGSTAHAWGGKLERIGWPIVSGTSSTSSGGDCRNMTTVFLSSKREPTEAQKEGEEGEPVLFLIEPSDGRMKMTKDIQPQKHGEE